MKVDAKKKLVTKYETTGANVHDLQVFDKLVDENDEAILADSAYLSEESRGHLIEYNCQDFIQLKGYRNHPLGEEDKKRNKQRKPYSGKIGARIWEDESVAMD